MAFGLLGGLLGAGILYLAATPPRGQPVTLLPAPTAAPITVHILGGVVNPGVYQLPVGSRIEDVLKEAGGLAAEGDAEQLNLAALLLDGEQVVIPVRQPTALPDVSSPVGLASPAERSAELPLFSQSAQPPKQDGLININTATLDELESLPGIGPVIAQRIIDHRQQYGSFQTKEATMDVKGIGPATYERVKDLITVTAAP